MPYLEVLPSSLPRCLEIPLGKVTCFLGTVPRAPSCFHGSVKCLCVLWAQYLLHPGVPKQGPSCGWHDWVHACAGGLFKAFLGRDYTIMCNLLLRFLHKGSFTLPDRVHTAFLSCHLKNECIIVLNLEIWFWSWFSGKLTYRNLRSCWDHSFRGAPESSLSHSCSVMYRVPGCLLCKNSRLVTELHRNS